MFTAVIFSKNMRLM